jgi:LDH2 family malate/lactate/ureidoglycolate dehydrogenase
MLAEKGFIGIVTSNTRPLMPALGGAEPVVGNNPLAIALPSAEGFPLVLDMAMSESAMGKIRLAAAQGRAIPDTWATDSNGRPTTDAGEAIKGMLLPAAGAKGFGLAFMMDLLCGALSGGGTGGAVRPLYDNLSECYNCSHLFLALDVARFVDTNLFGQSVVAAAQRVRESKRAPGTSRIYAPGDPARQALETNGGFCPLARETAKQLMKLNGEAGADRPFQFNLG